MPLENTMEHGIVNTILDALLALDTQSVTVDEESYFPSIFRYEGVNMPSRDELREVGRGDDPSQGMLHLFQRYATMETTPQENAAKLYFWMGSILADRGRLDEATVHYDRSINLETDPAWIWMAEHSKGIAFDKLELFNEAISSYTKAVSAAHSGAQSATWMHLAALFKKLGRIDESLNAYEEWRKGAAGDSQADALIQKGSLYREIGLLDEAMGCLEEAWQLEDITPLNRSEAKFQMGIVWEKKGCSRNAIECWSDVAGDDEYPLHVKSRSLWNLIVVHRNLGNLSAGLVAEVDLQIVRMRISFSHHMPAVTHELRKLLDLALRTGHSKHATEIMRLFADISSLAVTAMEQERLSETFGPALQAVAFRLASVDPTKALLVLESARQIVTRSAIAEKRARILVETLFSASDNADELDLKISENAQFEESPEHPRREEANALDALCKRIQDQLSAEAMTIEVREADLLRYIKEDDVYLSYLILKDHITLLLADSTQIQSVIIPQGVSRIEELLSPPNAPSRPLWARTRLTSELSNLLLPEKVLSSIKKAKKVWITPTGNLWSVPFEHLIDQAGVSVFGSKPCIAYTPSLATVNVAQRSKIQGGGAPVLLGVSQFSPRRGCKKRQHPDKAQGFTREEVELSDLPQVPDELDKISQIHGIDHVLLDENATFGAMIGAFPKASFMHICTHIIMRDASPLKYEIVLSDGTTGLDFVPIKRLLHPEMRTLAKLVVLSCCASGQGSERAGEGFAGLVTPFLQAGVSTVIATRWPIVDHEAGLMMVKLHQLLGRRRWIGSKRTVAEALRECCKWAQRNHISPKTWQAFMLFGDPDTRL